MNASALKLLYTTAYVIKSAFTFAQHRSLINKKVIKDKYF